MQSGLRKRRARRGATLIELLVALLLLDLALITLAALSAVAVGRVGEAGRRNRSAIAATNRIESLSSRACGAGVSGSQQLEPGVSERWSTTRGAGLVEIVDSIRIDSRPPEIIVLRSRTPC